MFTLKEETPEQRRRVLIFGWTAVGIAILLGVLVILSARPLEQKPVDLQHTNNPAK